MVISCRNISAQLDENLRQQKRVAAQIEKVVVESDLLEPEHFLPDAPLRSLRLGLRGDVPGFEFRARRVCLRQSLAINLAVRRERHGLK